MDSEKSHTRSNNQSQLILRAACDVVAKQGVSKLTISSAAAEAGISKGGVLYHYPTKEALLEGMLSVLLTTIESRRESAGEVSHLSAMLNTIDLDDESDRSLSLAMMAAGAQNPELLIPAKDYFSERVNEIKQESNDKNLASILVIALEGMRFLTMLNLNPWSLAESKSILKRMNKLAMEVTS